MRKECLWGSRQKKQPSSPVSTLGSWKAVEDTPIISQLLFQQDENHGENLRLTEAVSNSHKNTKIAINPVPPSSYHPNPGRNPVSQTGEMGSTTVSANEDEGGKESHLKCSQLKARPPSAQPECDTSWQPCSIALTGVTTVTSSKATLT